MCLYASHGHHNLVNLHILKLQPLRCGHRQMCIDVCSKMLNMQLCMMHSIPAVAGSHVSYTSAHSRAPDATHSCIHGFMQSGNVGGTQLWHREWGAAWA